MSRDKRHTRTLPNGEFVVTTLACEDTDISEELSLCGKTGFELGREWLGEPLSLAGKAFIAEVGPEWRLLVHHKDWVSWGESLPLDPCVCVDVKSLSGDN